MFAVYSEDGQPNTIFSDTLLMAFNSLRVAVPGCQTCLYTNIEVDNTHWIYDQYGFNHVIYNPDSVKYHIIKAHALKESPFEKTIYLDTDMIFHSERNSTLNDIFDILDTWEIAGLHGNHYSSGEIKPDIHCGLLGVKKNDSTNLMMDQWISNFTNALPENTSDQSAFRNIFYENHSKFYILPHYFMFRWHMLQTVYDHAVTTHGIEMNQQVILRKIITSLEERKN